MAVGLDDGQDFALHGGIGFAVTFTANGPAIHIFRHMTQRRDFADFIQVFFFMTTTERQNFSSRIHGLHSLFGVDPGCAVNGW